MDEIFSPGSMQTGKGLQAFQGIGPDGHIPPATKGSRRGNLDGARQENRSEEIRMKEVLRRRMASKALLTISAGNMMGTNSNNLFPLRNLLVFIF